jgi:predicted ATPase
VACRAYAAATLWWLGYPDQALQRSHEALTLAREPAHPYSLGFALFFAAMLHQFRREWPLTQERAEAAIALSAEQGFVHWGGGGRSFGVGRWLSGMLSLWQDGGKRRRAWPRCIGA